MKIVDTWKQLLRDANATANTLHRVEALAAGQHELLNDKLEALVHGSINQQRLLNDKLGELILGLNNQSDLINQQIGELIETILATGWSNGAAGFFSNGAESNAPMALASQVSIDGRAHTSSGSQRFPAPIPMAERRMEHVNRMERYAHVFDGIRPWAGDVPKGCLVDFNGVRTDAKFREMFGVDPTSIGGRHEQTRLPAIEDGEGWFEAANWVLAAREARDRFVMITLGACYGAQAVGSYRMLQQLNPMPCKLVAVEPVPDNFAWTAQHFRDNDIDPDQHWLVPLAIASSNEPVLFPVGAPGSGAQNSVATNSGDARKLYRDQFLRAGPRTSREALSNLLLHNTTGLIKELVPGEDFKAEIKLVSAVTLHDLLGPFDRVDYLESDIQQSEIEVFPPFIQLLRKKVHRIHIGTHGTDVHWALHDLFAENGWEIIFSFEPNAQHETSLGRFETNDGVLTVLNPDL